MEDGGRGKGKGKRTRKGRSKKGIVGLIVEKLIP
jgi:hypothetical protein